MVFLFCIFSSIVLPVFNVLYWALQGREKFAVSNYLGAATYNSVVLASLTASFALLFAFPLLGWLYVKKANLLTLLTEFHFLGIYCRESSSHWRWLVSLSVSESANLRYIIH